MKKTILPYLLLLTTVGYCQTRVPATMKKAVAFIFFENDSSKIVPAGTGFYVGVTKDSMNTLGYIVTAKHVLKKANGEFLKKIYLRLSKRKDSSLVTISIDLFTAGKAKNVFMHSDTTVDIAVISVFPRNDTFDLLLIPHTWITTKEEFLSSKIMEGDEVFFTGMFVQYLGQKANYPITRFGRVALITDEKVFWNGSWRNLYLLETTTYWGNSGSPVYFALKERSKSNPNRIVIGTTTVIKLAGIMSGFFGDNVPGGFAETKLVPYQLVNFGISAITPAYLLWDILFSDELKRMRGF
jgi:hypothetical protein